MAGQREGGGSVTAKVERLPESLSIGREGRGGEGRGGEGRGGERRGEERKREGGQGGEGRGGEGRGGERKREGRGGEGMGRESGCMIICNYTGVHSEGALVGVAYYREGVYRDE